MGKWQNWANRQNPSISKMQSNNPETSIFGEFPGFKAIKSGQVTPSRYSADRQACFFDTFVENKIYKPTLVDGNEVFYYTPDLIHMHTAVV